MSKNRSSNAVKVIKKYMSRKSWEDFTEFEKTVCKMHEVSKDPYDFVRRMKYILSCSYTAPTKRQEETK